MQRNMTSDEDKFALPSRYKPINRVNVWIEYTQLDIDHRPLNISQGCPDFESPKHLLDALADVANSDDRLLQQYTRGSGHVRLINSLSRLYSPLVGRDIDPQREILVTSGALEAIYCSIMGHVDKGDEVIVIEPFFESYERATIDAGGTLRFIPLRKNISTEAASASSSEWALDTAELEGLFNSKTKAIVVNTPNNPLGKVFSKSELEVIANLCKKWNVLCISDEVYEWIVYKPNTHFRIVTLPGMWERTITIGSAGKTFSATGWKTGWAYGPAKLIHNLRMVHQNCVGECTTPIQEAVARCFEQELTRLGQDNCYFVSLPRELEEKRDYMIKFLSEAGMKPIIPEGGYFIMADYSPLVKDIDLSIETDKYKDCRFTKWMVKNVGLLGFPSTTFYSKPNKILSEDFVRYCFIKQDKTLQKAAEILLNWRANVK